MKNNKNKTWSNIDKTIINNDILDYIESLESMIPVISEDITLKSSLAFLKIYQIIETGYGQNINNDEWNCQTTKYLIVPNHNRNFYDFIIVTTVFFPDKCHIAFHTKEQADEFIIYPENIQLLKDYFMIDE